MITSEFLDQLEWYDLKEIDSLIGKIWLNNDLNFEHKDESFFKYVLEKLKEKHKED